MNDRFDKITPGSTGKLNLLVDILLVVLAVWATLESVHFGFVVSTAVVSWCVVAAVARVYSPCTPRGAIHDVVLGGFCVLAVVGITVGAYHLVATPACDLRFVELAVLWLAGSTSSRLLFARLLAPRINTDVDKVLVLGTGELGQKTCARLARDPSRSVVGALRFPGEPVAMAAVDVPVLGEADHLLELLADVPINEVYIAGHTMKQGLLMQEAIRSCEEVGMPFAVPIHSFRYERAKLLSSWSTRDGYLHYLNTKSRPVEYAIKRLFDIVASATALVLLLPLLVTVAIVIKLTSRGPVLFRQVRVGLHGAHFNLLKFRSMVVNAEALKGRLQGQNEQTGPVFKMKNDPRVTRIGRFIRQYSIDELPQLVNVLRGDMTLVGPRPALPAEVREYKAWHRRRLSVRPGLTCFWQVGGRNEIGFEDWMRLDLHYVDTWSLKTDLHLILQTFPVVLTGRGAS